MTDGGDDFDNPFERFEYENALRREPGLTVSDYRARRAVELEEWHAQRAAERERAEQAKESRRREQDAFIRHLIAANPWATRADLGEIQRLLAEARPGETWGDLAERLGAIDDGYRRLLQRLDADAAREPSDGASESIRDDDPTAI